MRNKRLVIISVMLLLLGIILLVLYFINANNKTETLETYDITLNGEERVVLKYGEKYLESGYIAINSNNQDVTDKVVIVGSVDEKIPGEYQIKYVIDGKIIKERTVIVKEKENVNVLPNADVVYFPQLPKDAKINGDSTIIESNGKYAIIDVFTLGTCTPLLNFIKSKKIKEFEFMIVTHFHGDHTQCLLDFKKQNIKIKKIYFKEPNPNISDYEDIMYNTDSKKQYYNIVKSLPNTTYESINSNKVFKFNDFTFHIYNAPMRITSPTQDSKATQNDESLVVSIVKGTNRFAITGDIRQCTGVGPYYQNLANAIGKVDVLKLSHHGIRGNNPDEVLKAFSPNYAIVTNCNKSHETVPLTINYLKNNVPNFIKEYWTIDGLITCDVTNSSSALCKQ